MPQGRERWPQRIALARSHGVCNGDGMRRPLLVLVLLASLCVFATGASAATSLASLQGTWSGVDMGVTPEIRVTLKLSGGANGSTVRLAGKINCSGRETFTGRTATSFRFQERILRSTSDHCIGLGWVTLTPRADGSLAYHWTDGGTSHARAILQRVVL